MVDDTPSPVDLSMPPPAPPGEGASGQQGQASPTSPAAIAPVTPAAIMGLGRLGLSSGLAPLDGSVDGAGSSVGAKRKSPPKAGPSSSSNLAYASHRIGQSTPCFVLLAHRPRSNVRARRRKPATCANARRK